MVDAYTIEMLRRLLEVREGQLSIADGSQPDNGFRAPRLTS
jgi:hypothetical protein